jgi:predicted dehydrogenase
MAETLGVAIAGTGFMGSTHTEALRRLGLPVVGILGSSPEKSRRAAASLGIGKAYADFDEVLADPEVQSIHLATPNRLHYPMARAALLAGRHVLCEKPLAMTSAESAELVELARTANVAAGVNYNMRFYPLNLESRERIRRGDLGEVYSVQGSYVQDWLLYPSDYNWRVRAEEGGALRAVADIGTHWLDLIHSLTGLAVEAVCADLRTVHPVRLRPKGEVETFAGKLEGTIATEPIEVATEDLGSILLRFRGGTRGSLFVSQATAGRKNCLRYEIAGANAALAWNSEAPNELWIGRRDRPNEILVKDPSLLSDAARSFTSYPGGHNEGYPDTFKQCFRAFYDYIRAGDLAAPPPFPTFADGHEEIRLCDAILDSHRRGAWVSV